MAIKDNVSEMLLSYNANLVAASNGDLTGAGVDTADLELGLTLAAFTSVYIDGTHTLTAQESADNGVTDPWTDVPAEKLIIPFTDSNVANAAVSFGDPMLKVGVFSNKRWVRPKLTSEGVTGGATFAVISAQKAEQSPVGS